MYAVVLRLPLPLVHIRKSYSGHVVPLALDSRAMCPHLPPPRLLAAQVRALIEPHAGGPVDPSSNASLAAALERACAAAAAASDPAAAQVGHGATMPLCVLL